MGAPHGRVKTSSATSSAVHVGAMGIRNAARVRKLGGGSCPDYDRPRTALHEVDEHAQEMHRPRDEALSNAGERSQFDVRLASLRQSIAKLDLELDLDFGHARDDAKPQTRVAHTAQGCRSEWL